MILELTTPKSDLSLSTVSTSRFGCLTPAITTVGSPQPLRPSVAQRRHDPYWTAVTHYRRTVAAVRPPPCSEALPSLKEDNDELPYEGLASVAGGIVALGKFDALHVGHRELAIQASKVGVPFLLSFGGMAEVFGWEPRVPIVAKCDRKRVLSSWAPFCGSVVPEEVLIEFASVRHLSPRQFVEKLSKELGVRGVVAGENYRFGYKAAGDASELVRLCDDYGIGAYIIDSVVDKSRVDSVNSCDAKDRGQVSSTRVRYALARGDIHYVTELLGRPHRLMLSVENNTGFVSTKSTISCPKFQLLNLPPGDGLYENCSLVLGDENPVPCRVIIDATHVHVESDDTVYRVLNASQDLQLLAIEFGQV